MALNFITLNRKDEAESAVRGLLSQEPGYELPKNESPRFRDFFSNAKKKGLLCWLSWLRDRVILL